MRKISFFLFLIAVLVAGCSLQTPAKTRELPLEKGTTWIYSYQAYQQSTSDPNQIAEALYQLTEAVVETETTSSYFVAHVKQDYELVKADVDWPGGEFTDDQLETWYVVSERRIFESREPIDQNYIKTDNLILAYDFPLSLNKIWCLTSSSVKDTNQKDTANCESVGKRVVTHKEIFELPPEKFDSCYEIVDYFNTGNFIQWFCEGVGLVFRKFDHAGTRFGFQQTLIAYSVGVP